MVVRSERSPGLGLWLLVIGLVAVSGFFAFDKYKNVQKLERLVLETNEKQLKIANSIDDFYQHSGYGGFIHNFKNYILRQEENYLVTARLDLKSTLSSLENLQRVAALYEIEISLTELSNTLNQYGQKLLEVESLVQQGLGPAEIDKAVSVSDFAAVFELTLTMQALAGYLKNDLSLLVEQLERSQKDLKLLLLLCLCSVVIGVVVSARVFVLSGQKVKLKESAWEDQQKLLLAHEAERLGKIGHWFLDQSTDTVWWSEGVFNIHERNRSLGMPTQKEIANYFDPVDQPIIKSRVEDAVKNHSSFEFTKRITMLDGRVKIIRVSGEAKEIGATDTLFGIIQDITDETNAALENKALLGRIKLARQTLLMGVWELDLTTQTMTWDEEMHQLFDLPEANFRGHMDDWINKVHPEDLSSTRTGFRTSIENAEPLEIQYRILSSDQTVKWLESRALVVRNRLGKPIKLLGISIDITKSKEDEAALAVALDAANIANEAKSEFLAVMSHEIRTPLSGLIGILELLQEQSLKKEARDLVTTALSSSAHLLTVLSDILEFSRIEAGKLEIVDGPFNLNLMLDQITALHRSAATNKQLDISLVLPPEEMTLIGDEQRIRQIVSNFLGNAIKFTNEGQIELKCDVVRDTTDNSASLTISVSDQGIGIPEEKLSCLFTPFEQVDNSRTRNFGGTGLGLSICKKLAAQMNGSVDVESVEGQGSTFYVSLKLPITSEEIEPDILDKTVVKLPKLKILAAEDVALNQFILKSMVGDRMKQDLTVVSNGLEVLDRLQNEKFDVVLMDVQMPQMDGVTATETIRESDEGYKDIPIIGLTANALASQQKEYISAGMNACVSKPFNWEELKDVLQELVVA